MSLTFVTGGLGATLLGNLADPARYALIKTAWSNMPVQLLPLEHMFDLFNRGLLTKERFKGFANDYGFEVENWDRSRYRIFTRTGEDGPLIINAPVYDQAADLLTKHLQIDKLVLTPDDVLTMLNRGLITEQTARWFLYGHFKGETSVVNRYMELRYEIPPLTDLIQFAVKEAFDPDTITRMGYNKELPVDIVPWMRKLGYGGKSGMPIPRGATTNKGAEVRTQAEWLDHYWYAHWTNLSPTQWFESLHRFYEESPYGASPEFRRDIATTTADVEAGLKVADYPEPLRKRLLALSYSPLTRVDVRRMFQLGVLNREQVYHAYRAIGYDNTNAESLTAFTEVDINRKRFSSTRQRVLRVAEKQVKLGMIGLAEYRSLTGRVNIPADEGNARYDLIISELRADKANLTVKKIKRWFFNGQLSIDLARSALMGLELDEGFIQEWLKEWTLERDMGRKFISAGKLVDMFKKRLINEIELETKLFNLGYNASEVSLIIQEAKHDIQSLQIKEKLQQDKEAKQETDKVKLAASRLAEKNERKVRQEEKASLREKEEKLRKGLAAFTEKNLVLWFKEEQIDEEAIDIILDLKGWTLAAKNAFKTVQLGIEPPDEE